MIRAVKHEETIPLSRPLLRQVNYSKKLTVMTVMNTLILPKYIEVAHRLEYLFIAIYCISTTL